MKSGLEGTLYLRVASTPEINPIIGTPTRYVTIEEALRLYSRERVVAMLREAADSIEKDGWWR